MTNGNGHAVGGGDAPYGYRVEGGRVVEVPAEQEVLDCARELLASGLSLRAVARELDRHGFRSRGAPRTRAGQG